MSTITLASWNVNSLRVRLPQVLDWLASSRTDALVIQETKLTDDQFPRAAFEEAGMHVLFTGQKTYNGVALVARKESFRRVEPLALNLPGYPDEQKRLVEARLETPSGASLVFTGVYVPNGSEPGAQKYLYKLDWLAALERHLTDRLSENPNLVIGGDFNIAPADIDCWNPKLFEGAILASAPERLAFSRLLSLGLVDSFRTLNPGKNDFSWWDYRNRAFDANEGVRIDHLLVSQALADSMKSAAVDHLPRANKQPSDHAPVTLTLEL